MKRLQTVYANVRVPAK